MEFWTIWDQLSKSHLHTPTIDVWIIWWQSVYVPWFINIWFWNIYIVLLLNRKRKRKCLSPQIISFQNCRNWIAFQYNWGISFYILHFEKSATSKLDHWNLYCTLKNLNDPLTKLKFKTVSHPLDKWLFQFTLAIFLTLI